MDLIHITQIKRFENLPQITAFALESPQQADRFAQHTFIIQGWVIGKQSRPQAIKIHCPAFSELLALCAVVIPRPEIAEHYPEQPAALNSGFLKVLSTIGLPETTELTVEVIFEDHSSAHIATINLHRQYLFHQYQPQLQLLSLTSLPRSGSTWLMHCLAQHPQIAVHREYPYEAHPAKFWLYNSFKSLVEPTNYLNANSEDNNFNLHLQWIGHYFYTNPDYRQWFGEEYLQQVVEFCMQSVDTFYQKLASSSSRSTYYFAEKFGVGYVLRILQEIYPQGKEIVLVRDFRDIFCSMLVFTQQLNKSGFSVEANKALADNLQGIKNSASIMWAHYQNKQQTSYLLRYEDLLRSPITTLTQLFGYLELENNSDLIKKLLDTAQATMATEQHLTSQTVQKSIGRWQRELTPSLQRQLNPLLEIELRTFGYIN